MSSFIISIIIIVSIIITIIIIAHGALRLLSRGSFRENKPYKTKKSIHKLFTICIVFGGTPMEINALQSM